MITLIGEQIYAFLMMALILFTPGWAISRLLETQLSFVPRILMMPIWFVLGLFLWTIALIPVLSFGLHWRAAMMIYALLSLFLVAIAREKSRRYGHAKKPFGDASRWTITGVILTTLLAAVFRTRIAFDTIFHIGLVRRIAELDAITFTSLDRVVGAGINPSYAIPTWQALMAAVSGVTGLDPATIVEAMAAFVVMIAACTFAGLGRLLTDKIEGEIAAVAGYAWLRVYFPRRELEGDGIAYAALPGNIALDIVLPLALCAGLVLMLGVTRRRGAIVVGAAASALIVILHANYIVYLALIGVGCILWLAATSMHQKIAWKNLRTAALALALPGAIILAALLPILALLEQFGAPVEARLDYHLIGSGALKIVRPGHLYDWFAAPGIVAMLLLPVAVYHLRGVRQALIGGGALIMMLAAFVPPFRELIDATGSLTIMLRISRPFGIMLIAVIAVVLPLLAARVQNAGTSLTRKAWGLGALMSVLALSEVYGYPLARREPAEYGWNWPTLVALGGVIAVFIITIRKQVHQHEAQRQERRTDAVSATVATGVLVLLLTASFMPSGAVSLRRGAWQAKELVASYQADDLACLSAISGTLRELPAGEVVLTDPITAYDLQALAPVHIIADYKLWNGATDTSRAAKRINKLRAAFHTSSEASAKRAIYALSREYNTNYVLVANGVVEPPLSSTVGDFDAAGLRAALASGQIPAELIDSGQGNIRKDDAPDAACNVSLWKMVEHQTREAKA